MHVLHLNEGTSNTYGRLGIVARFGECTPPPPALPDHGNLTPLLP